MQFDEFFDRGVIDPLGYRPKSASIKPVHIANGLSRFTLGRVFDERLLNRTVNPTAKPKKDPGSTTTERLVADAGERFGAFAETTHRSGLELLRELLQSVLDADSGVYNGSEFSSYTLTNKRLVTSDNNDHGSGRFLHRLLATDVGSGPSPVLGVLATLLEDDTDEISVLTIPLLGDDGGRELKADAEGPPESLQLTGGRGRAKTFASPTVQRLRTGFDTLGAFVATNGGKLENLRRIVTFASLALYVHIIQRASELADEDGVCPRRPPILLDAIQEGWTPVGLASHATYLLASKSVDRLIAHGLRSELLRIRGGRWSSQNVTSFIEDLGLNKKGTDRERARKRKNLQETFEAYQGSGRRVLDAFVLALVDLVHEELTATPFDFARGLGVRSGLLAPRGNRAVRKRYVPSAEVIEVLLASTLHADDEVSLEELADRWWEQYGIIVGCRNSDARDLSAFSIQDATKDDLATNAKALRELLISIGYARRYADGVTIIRLNGRGGR